MTGFFRRWKWTLTVILLVAAANVICVFVWHNWWVPVGTALGVGNVIWEYHRGVRR